MESAGVVTVPSPELPGVTQTLGFKAAQIESSLSTLAWCKKNMGSKATSKEKWLIDQFMTTSCINTKLTSDVVISHMAFENLAHSANLEVYPVMNCLETVASTWQLILSVSGESRPVKNLRQHSVSSLSDIRTVCIQISVIKVVRT